MSYRLMSAVYAAVLSCFVIVAYVGATLGAANAADAQQPTLTAAQIASIQVQVKAAIDAVNAKQFDPASVDPSALALCNCMQVSVATQNQPNDTTRCTNANKNAALAQAISDQLIALVQTYGAQSAGEISSVIMATAMSAGVPASAVGVGLGRGAQQIAQTNGASATLVAQDIANEGTADIANCFASAAGPQLASIAKGPPSTTGTGGNPGGPNNPPPGVVPVTATSAS